MSNRFRKSPEGVAAYDLIKYPYPTTVNDELYEQKFLKQTRRSPDELNQKIVTQAIRIQSSFVDEKQNPEIEDKEMLSGEKLREYIIYSVIERRIDPLGNERHFFRPNLGKYSIPVPRYAMRKDAEGYEERYVAGIMDERVGYSIIHNKKNADKLRKDGCTSEDPKELAKEDIKRQKAAAAAKAVISARSANEQTFYYVQKEGEQRKYTVRSYEDWRDGSFEDLISFGHANVTKEEWNRKRAIDEVAAAQRMNTDVNIEDKINEAANRNKGAGQLYK